jgi:hypothetical protein
MVYIEFNTPNQARTSRTLPLILPNRNNPQIKWYTMKSLFSDNSCVCQKPRMNYGGSVGTVSNSRKKSKYT